MYFKRGDVNSSESGAPASGSVNTVKPQSDAPPRRLSKDTLQRIRQVVEQHGERQQKPS
jgi:hypothetical protein